MGCYEDPDDGDDWYTYWDSNGKQPTTATATTTISEIIVFAPAGHCTGFPCGHRPCTWRLVGLEKRNNQQQQ